MDDEDELGGAYALTLVVMSIGAFVFGWFLRGVFG